MHFIINKVNLLKIKNLLLISTTSITTENKNENILITTSKNSIDFYTNNGITSCKLIIENTNVKILEEGKIFVNSKILIGLIDNLKEYESIEFKKIDTKLLQVTSGKFTCNLVCFAETNYLIDSFDNIDYEKISINYNTLKTINNRFKDFCKPFASNVIKNSILTNINIKTNEKKDYIHVSSTDSYRIVFAEFPYSGKKFDINILPQILGNIISLFSNFEGKEIDLYINEENFLIKTDEFIYKTKLFVGKYPDFSEWFLSEPKVKIEIEKSKLLSALDRNLFLSNNYIKTTFYKLKDSKLMIEYKDSEKGSSKEDLQITNIKKTDIEFSLNSLLLKQLVKNIPCDVLNFDLMESLKPIILYGKDSDKNFKQFILPLKGH